MPDENRTAAIPVLLCYDSNYAYFAAVATYSAFIASESKLKFYWMLTSECLALAEKLKNHLSRFGVEIELVVVDLKQIAGWKTGYHFSPANYLRLFAPNCLSQESRVIYIDCDTLVLTDLRELFETDMRGSSLAGVIDEGAAAYSKVPRSSTDIYINSGVMLMNLDALRLGGFLESSQALYEKHKDEITWPDQCLINKYAENDKISLDQKWNRRIFSERIVDKDFFELADAGVSSILHFVGGVKPWQSWCSPAVSDFWWRYAAPLKIDGLRKTPITTVDQLIDLADSLHLNGRFEESSGIRGNITQELLKHLTKSLAKG